MIGILTYCFLHVREVQHIFRVWHNSNIVIGSKAFVYKKYVEKGIIFINDLCDELGNLRTF